jgi:hypothetical protein
MIDEPNSHNQNHHHGDLEADTAPLLEEVDALARRLISDGDFARSRLPDSAQMIERIRAISHETLLSASEGDFPMFEDDGNASQNSLPVGPHQPRPASFIQRLGSLAAVVVVLALVGTMALVFYSAHHTSGSSGGGSSNNPTSTSTTALEAFQITSVAMSAKPASVTGMTCGTTVTVTYTAVFHATPRSPGGTVQFTYTVNNGRGQSPASVTFAPRQTEQSYKFNWSGALPDDHTYPGPGGVQVTSPNQLTSQLVMPTGQCTPPATPPACGSNFSSPISQSYQSTLSTDFGTVPLPPLSRTVPNDASGGVRGYDICSAGTISTITVYMEQNLPSYGWTLVSNSGGIESWKSSTGTINWSVTDPLEWNINWRVSLG